MSEQKPEEKKEDIFTKLGRTIIDNFLKQWKIWSQKTRILFILFAGAGLIALLNGALSNFVVAGLCFLFGLFTCLWLVGVMEDIKKLKASKQPEKKVEE